MKYKLLAIALIAICASAAVPVTWSVDLTRVAPVALEAYHGETLSLTASLGFDVPAGSATFLWQTNGMGTSYWQRPATVSADGIVRGTFSPEMDTGADVVRFFFSVVSGGANYRASGTIRLRPSPGATPSTIDLPNAQTVNFADIDIINAPWLTAEETAEAIRAATNSVHAAAVNEIEAAQGQNALHYCTIEAAAAIARAATNHADAAVAALQIPSLSGYATQEWVGQQGYLTQHQSLTNYATIAWVQSLYDGIDIPSLDGYATQAWVGQQGYLTQHQDLSGYATTAYTASAIAAALSGYLTAAQAAGLYASTNQVAALLSGYATEQYVQDAVGGVQVPSLDGYATREWVEGGLSNLADRSDARYLQSVPPGYATEQYVQTAIDGIDIPDLSAYATRTEVAEIQTNVSAALDAQRTLATAQADAAEARAKDYARNLSYASGVGNTRLVTEDGRTWQDATGTVWKVSDVWGWVGTAWTNNVSLPVTFYPDGSGTNWGSDIVGMRHLVTDGGDVPYMYLRDDVNPSLSQMADSMGKATDTNLTWESISPLLGVMSGCRVQIYKAVVALETNTVRKVAYTDTPVASAEDARRIVTRDGTQWTDADGQIWKISYTPAHWRQFVGEDEVGTSDGWTRVWYTSYYDLYGGYPVPDDPSSNFSAWFIENPYGTPGAIEAPPDATSLGPAYIQRVDNYTATLVPAETQTNLVGRVALTNDVPSTPGDIGAAPASVADTVQAWQTYWDGDDVRVTVTNYYGSIDIPHLYIEQKMPADDQHAAAWFKTIWDEMTRWNAFIGVYAALTNHVERDLADRAWGVYDSSTGAYSPDGLLQVSQPEIQIAAGLAYQKTITSSGELWVLTATEPLAIGGESTNGYFRITDGEGNPLFEIVKGDKRTVGSTAGGIRVVGDEVQIDYMLTDNSSVEIRRTTDLRNGTWETVDATWTGTSGAYTAHVAKPTGPSASAFYKASYEVGGETYIKNSAPISANGGILCTDGIHKCRPVYNNGSITWEVVP